MLAQKEGIKYHKDKQDGWAQTKAPYLQSMPSDFNVWYLREVGERTASTSHLTNKEGGEARWKVGQEQAGLL